MRLVVSVKINSTAQFQGRFILLSIGNHLINNWTEHKTLSIYFDLMLYGSNWFLEAVPAPKKPAVPEPVGHWSAHVDNCGKGESEFARALQWGVDSKNTTHTSRYVQCKSCTRSCGLRKRSACMRVFLCCVFTCGSSSLRHSISRLFSLRHTIAWLMVPHSDQ